MPYLSLLSSALSSIFSLFTLCINCSTILDQTWHPTGNQENTWKCWTSEHLHGNTWLNWQCKFNWTVLVPFLSSAHMLTSVKQLLGWQLLSVQMTVYCFIELSLSWKTTTLQAAWFPYGLLWLSCMTMALLRLCHNCVKCFTVILHFTVGCMLLTVLLPGA